MKKTVKANKGQLMSKKQKRLFVSGIIAGTILTTGVQKVTADVVFPLYNYINNKIDEKNEQAWNACMEDALERHDGDVQGSRNECRRSLYN